ncbi:MAG: glycosyltransferase [Caldisericia bacterium]|nr:glycosyltransferase [Caldisericia bacterium]
MNLLRYFVIKIIPNFLFWFPVITSIFWTISAIHFYNTKEKKEYKIDEKSLPPVTIIIAAHNEEKFIKDTLEALKNLNYPKYDVIVVDDASKDKTPKIVEEYLKFENFHFIKLNKNVGKAMAVNIGVLHSKTDLVVVIDADTILDKDSLKYVAHHFKKIPRLAAVTGNPRVLNRTNILTYIQTAEFSSIISLLKRSQRSIGRIFTVSGAFTTYNKNVLKEVGCFSHLTATEDIDITWRIEKNFYNVFYEPKAIAWIRVPESLKELIRQRKRWALGGWHMLRIHFDILFNFKYKRLFIAFIEFVLAYIWSILFIVFSFLWILSKLFLYKGFTISPIPTWYGAFISLVCLVQFFVSSLLDKKYDKGIFKYYFFVVWYPIIYWTLNPILVFITLKEGLFGILEGKGIWHPPDRKIKF